ncbi:cytochrome P450 [Aspergillus sclerotiicarbonarius CBS 121057]|uniref:Cytochrome P450 n=1 Tax=Aspergillus sclerotiicarbonarius (strain CBS 121057 / IBT 28362) TaxID=1448318 RepID=A0A319F3A4_ASPSB|nr:cytochrome P450 [Aspergillus sclerotiicarbonarius CBS 121057]
MSISLVLLVFVRQLFSYLTVNTRSNTIRDSQGQPIKELKQDARLLKFISSLELSNMGKELADDKPYIIQNGRCRELVVTQPDHLRDFYGKDTKDHPKPANLNMGEYFGRILGDAAGVQVGERWKIIRKYFDPEFAHGISMQALEKFSCQIHVWADALQTTPAGFKTSPENDENHGFIVDLTKSMKFLPFKLVALQMYGEAFTEELYDELLDINNLHVQILHDVIGNKKLASKLGNWLPSAAKNRMDLYLNRWRSFNLDIIQRARDNNLSCPVERIYRGVDHNREMKQTEFLHTLDEILFANVDVSSAVLNTMFSQLAATPAFQAALRTEILQWKKDTPDDKNMTRYISKQDTLLNFAIMESMRLTPAFWFSLPECTAAAKMIGGYSIPPNMPVVIDARRLNTESATWGDDGRVFRPERFSTISQTQSFIYGTQVNLENQLDIN